MGLSLVLAWHKKNSWLFLSQNAHRNHSIISSMVDISIGGLWIALMKILFSVKNTIQGAECRIPKEQSTSVWKFLMGETANSYLMSISPGNKSKWEDMLKSYSIQWHFLGKATVEISVYFPNRKKSKLQSPVEKFRIPGKNSFRKFFG